MSAAPGSAGPTLPAAIWRYRLPIVVLVVLAAVGGYYLSTLIPPVYEATSAVLLADAAPLDSAAVDIERKVQQEANRITSRSVLDRAASTLGSDMSSDGLLSAVTIDADPLVGLLTITAEAGDADRAAEIANAVTRAYRQEARDGNDAQITAATGVLEAQAQELRDEINSLRSNEVNAEEGARVETLQAQVLALEIRISEMQANAALAGAGIADTEPATPPESPTTPRPARNAVIVGAFSFAIAGALAYWRAGVVDRAQLDPAAILGSPLLAEIPLFQGFGGSTKDTSINLEAAEAYQFLLTSFEYTVAQTDARSILVTSVLPGDGKTLTSLHLARALAIQGRRIVLVDSDLRARGLTSVLGADEHPGLVALADGASLGDVVREYRISDDVSLPVIPAGQPSEQPTGLLATDRYRKALAKVVANNDLTLVDGAPLLTVADASAVAGQLDAVLLVMDAQTSQSDLVRVKERLQLTSTPLLGYVMNRVPDVRRFQYPYARSEPSQPSSPFHPLRQA